MKRLRRLAEGEEAMVTDSRIDAGGHRIASSGVDGGALVAPMVTAEVATEITSLDSGRTAPDGSASGSILDPSVRSPPGCRADSENGEFWPYWLLPVVAFLPTTPKNHGNNGKPGASAFGQGSNDGTNRLE